MTLQPPRTHFTHRLVHLTDPHLVADGALLHGRIEPWSRMFSALSAAAHFRPDAVVITGDLSQRDNTVHHLVDRLLAQAEEQLNCPIITLPGNHDPVDSVDDRFNAHRVTQGPSTADTAHHVNGLRVIALDSHGRDTSTGHLDDVQLDWLSEMLTEPAPAGTVLALHHPPIPTTHAFLSTVGLTEPEKLRRVLGETDVRLVLCGHLHLTTAGALGGIPVWVGPALSYNHNLFAPDNTLQGLDSSWLSVVDLHEDTHAVTPVPVQTPPAVFTRHFSPDRPIN